MRSSSASRSREETYKRRAIVLALLAVAVLAGLGTWKFFGHSEAPTDLLCSSSRGPSAHVILLVDKTDPLTFTQGKAFHQIIEDFTKGKYVHEGELLSVFVLGQDFRDTADPVFERCNPGDGSLRSKVTENPELWRRKYQNEFVKPLMDFEQQMRASQSSKWSPILEMLQVVAIRFAKYDVHGRRSLFIVSDMLHNTPDYSLYRDPIDYDVLKRKPAFSRLRSKLETVEGNIFLLLNSPPLQTRKLSKFWEDYLRDMGGSLEKIESLPG